MDYMVGEIVQINPSVEMFGGCMMVVTEPKEWGAMGYIQSAGVPGQQYVRIKSENLERTGGLAPWMVGDDE